MNRVSACAASLLSTALILTGCANMPTTGDVRAGVDFPTSESGSVDLLAEGPQGGETPEQIVDYFLGAQAAWQSDELEAAKAFLTLDAREGWNPHERVLVHRGDDATSIIGTVVDGDGEIQETVLDAVDPDATSVTIEKSVVPLANVALDGVRTEMDSRDRTPLRFQVELDDSGEWRISELPDGLVLSQANFDIIYQRVPLYFLSFDREYLVPEIRWVPSQNTPSHVVQGLVAGPSAVWSRTLFSEFPTGTPSAAPTVTVERGVAEVDLPSTVTALDVEARAYLHAQFDHSLRALRGINRVELRLNGQPLNITEPADVIVHPVRNDIFFILEEAGLYSMSGGSPTLVRDEIPEEWLEAADLVIDEAGEVRAIVNGDRTEITVRTNPALEDLVFTGADISDVSVDRFGWLWFSITRESEDDPLGGEDGTADDAADAQVDAALPMPFAPEHSVMAVHPDGTAVTVPQPWITTGTISALSVSYDGSRIAAVTHADDVRSVELSGIERDNVGRPRTIGVSTRQAKTLLSPVDVAWVNDHSLVVVAESSLVSRESVNMVEISGKTTPLASAFDSIRSVSVGSATQSTYVLTDDDELHHLVGALWQPVRNDVDVLWADYAN